MRVCPTCGYEDQECWRNLRWSLYQQYCDIEELEFWDPELVEKLKEKNPREQHPYLKGKFVYNMNRSGIVKRIAKKDYEMYGFERGIIESSRYTERLEISRTQRKLSAFVGS